MKKALASVAMLTLAGLLLGPAGVQAQKPRAERPTYAAGDKWIRSDGVFELVRVEKDLYVFAARPGWEILLTKDLGIARLQRGDSVLEIEPPLQLQWPLEVGKWGIQRGVWQTPDTRGQKWPVTVTWKVEDYEDVDVSAGRFKAFRIAWVFEASSSKRRWEAKSWYAPAVRQFIKVDSPIIEILTYQVVGVDRPAAGPLQIALEGLPTRERVGSDSWVLGATASASKGVARVSVSLNSAEVAAQDERRAPKGEVVLKVPLTFREGKNILIVTAVDADGTTRQEARGFLYEPGPGPPQPIGRSSPPAPIERPGSRPPNAVVPPPLHVTLSSPADQARVEQETIGLAGLAAGGKGVARVTVSLNGVELSRRDEPAPLPSVAVNTPVKLREGQNTVVVTATGVDGVIQQEVRTVHFEKPSPLSVALRYPEDRSRVSEESCVVAAVVTSSKGVARVTVTLNGNQVHEQSDKTPQRSVAVSAPITLRDGANAIVITATEPGGAVKQEVRTVILDRPKEVAAAPSPAAALERDRWAVVIGVGRYESPDVPRLRYTVSDAEALYQILIGPAGFKREHVLLLTDKTERPPTLRNIKWALGTFLARSARKDDTVLIFFAGHGAPEVDQRGVERDGLAKYLIPSDADPDDLYSTALPMDEMQTIFGRVEAERMVVFLDACYSGAAGGRTFSSKKTRAGTVDDLFLERLTRSKGRAIITASRPSEVSIELPELRHGIFTYYLVEGLKGAADLNQDGIVTVQELYEYVEAQVSKKSRTVGGNQHPVMKGEMEGTLPLVKVTR